MGADVVDGPHCVGTESLGISVIIPILNEEATIGNLLWYLRQKVASKAIREIIVVDGGSKDGSVAVVEAYDNVRIVHAPKGRAKQMNRGASLARGPILYFLHADTHPPEDFAPWIEKAVALGSEAGCFRMRFDSDSKFLGFFAWFSRINLRICRGGDQSLYITRDLFQRLGGFNERYRIYEDSEFIGRIYRNTKFMVLPREVVTSARKYKQVGTVRLQYHFGMIHLKNFLGADPSNLYAYYRKKILG